jgi:HlyD family secretion protein
MFIRYILPILAVLGFIFAIRTVIVSSKPPVPAAPVSRPSTSPFEKVVAGSGILEASSENIAISSHIAGVVSEVLVTPGTKVKAGDILFRVDDRETLANLLVDEAALQAAKAQSEDLKEQFSRRISMTEKNAVSAEELASKKYGLKTAEAKVLQAEAQVKARQTELERLKVRTPIDATVLQVKVRVGEFAQSGILSAPLLVLGNTENLHVRVDIDENDAWKIKGTAKAFAYVRGNPEISSNLQFVRFEPLVIPKKSLTGESSERVDTRVLQVIYKIEDKKFPAFVGQLMDVYVEQTSTINTTSN